MDNNNGGTSHRPERSVAIILNWISESENHPLLVVKRPAALSHWQVLQ